MAQKKKSSRKAATAKSAKRKVAGKKPVAKKKATGSKAAKKAVKKAAKKPAAKKATTKKKVTAKKSTATKAAKKKPAAKTKKKWGWGGWRPGAGRKPKHDVAGVPHEPRAALAPRFPVLVTMQVLDELPSVRTKAAYAALLRAFAGGCGKDVDEDARSGYRSRITGFRLTHFGLRDREMSLVVEAQDSAALSRGMQGLMVRIAKALNRIWNRKGKVFFDRYDQRILKTPTDVRDALTTALCNPDDPGLASGDGASIYSSAPWFDGFKRPLKVRWKGDAPETPVAEPRTSLLKSGWRRGGLLTAPKAKKR